MLHFGYWIFISSSFSYFCPIESRFEENLDQSDQMFKPGWKDIFRMNQSELEAEIRKVSQDSSLDPRRKAYLMQNLMTRFVILMLQQKSYRGFPYCSTQINFVN